MHSMLGVTERAAFVQFSSYPLPPAFQTLITLIMKNCCIAWPFILSCATAVQFTFMIWHSTLY